MHACHWLMKWAEIYWVLKYREKIEWNQLKGSICIELLPKSNETKHIFSFILIYRVYIRSESGRLSQNQKPKFQRSYCFLSIMPFAILGLSIFILLIIKWNFDQLIIFQYISQNQSVLAFTPNSFLYSINRMILS